ncbi:hypothetical protein [Thermococcus barophilus]|nr:hypothetical protein [Thermococcus barophilus]
MGMKLIILGILSLMFLGFMSSQTVQHTQETLKKISETTLFDPSVPPGSTMEHHRIRSTEENITHVDLSQGEYNLSEISKDLKDELLDPTDWYVGNTSLSLKYAIEVYTDTMNIVENATKTSESIIRKFLGLLSNEKTDITTVEKLLNETMEYVYSLKNMLKEGMNKLDES